MQIDGTKVVELASRFAWKFIRSMQSARHLREELEQEASLGILEAAQTFEEGRGTVFETWAFTVARKRMQVHCASHSGPVRRSCGSTFHGTHYAAQTTGTGDAVATGQSGATEGRHTRMDPTDYVAMREGRLNTTPQELAHKVNDAQRLLNEFLEKRTPAFRKGGKLSREQVKEMMARVVYGENYSELGEAYGVSRERVRVIADTVGVSAFDC